MNCGYCCTFNVILTDSEIKRVKEIGFEDFFVEDKDGNKIIKRKENGDCLFLIREGKKTKCQIYSARPFPCKNYPPYPQDKLCKEFNPAVRAYLYRIN